MNQEQRKRLRELADRATSGGWTAHISDHKDIPSRIGSIKTNEWFCEVKHTPKFRYQDGYEEGSRMSDNAEYIAFANPQAILSLLDRLDRYEEALEFYADCSRYLGGSEERSPRYGLTKDDAFIIKKDYGVDEFYSIGRRALQALEDK